MSVYKSAIKAENYFKLCWEQASQMCDLLYNFSFTILSGEASGWESAVNQQSSRVVYSAWVDLKTQYIETQIAYGEKLEMIRRQSIIDKTEFQVSLSKMICNKRWKHYTETSLEVLRLNFLWFLSK